MTDAERAKTARVRLMKDLDAISLDLVLDKLGAERNQDGDSSKWKIHGVGNIWYTGKIQAWKNLNTESKGPGGISLVAHARNIDRDAAVAWLVQEFGDQISDEMRAAVGGEEVRKEFIPPNAYPDAIAEVRRYLTGTLKEERGLPVSLIDAEIANGNIYATHPENKKTNIPYRGTTNCVFLAPVSAELRGTRPDGFKGTCEGADPDISGYRVAAAPAAAEHLFAMTEAAIDALSYRALFPGRFAFSTNGVNRFFLQLRLALEAVSAGYGVRLAFDADTPGDVGAQRIFNAFYLRTALAHSLRVSPEAIDEWIMNGDIELQPSESPHELFLRDGWKPSLPVHVARLGKDEEGRAKTFWEPSPEGEEAPPTVRLVARKDLHEKLRAGSHVVTVSAKGFAAVTTKYNVRRDRAVRGKDWNDELNQLGVAFLTDYERCARGGFKETPALPSHLQAVREPTPSMEVLLSRLTAQSSPAPASSSIEVPPASVVVMAEPRDPDPGPRIMGYAGRRRR